jgi:hypothetical protein
VNFRLLLVLPRLLELRRARLLRLALGLALLQAGHAAGARRARRARRGAANSRGRGGPT